MQLKESAVVSPQYRSGASFGEFGELGIRSITVMMWTRS
jgi:hypothetical protein